MAAFAALEAVTKGRETGILQEEEYMHLRQRVIEGDPRVIANWSGMASVYEPPSPTITPEIVADLKSNVDELRGMLVRDSSLTPARRKTLHPVAKRSKVVADESPIHEAPRRHVRRRHVELARGEYRRNTGRRCGLW